MVHNGCCEMAGEVESLFNKLQRIGVKEIVLFTRSGEVIKTTLDEGGTRNFIQMALDIVEDSNKIMSGLTGSNVEPNVIKATTESGELNIIISKKHILVYNLRLVNKKEMQYIELAEEIDKIFK